MSVTTSADSCNLFGITLGHSLTLRKIFVYVADWVDHFHSWNFAIRMLRSPMINTTSFKRDLIYYILCLRDLDVHRFFFQLDVSIGTETTKLRKRHWLQAPVDRTCNSMRVTFYRISAYRRQRSIGPRPNRRCRSGKLYQTSWS